MAEKYQYGWPSFLNNLGNNLYTYFSVTGDSNAYVTKKIIIGKINFSVDSGDSFGG